MVAPIRGSMLVEICTHCDITLAYKQLKSRPIYATPLLLPPELSHTTTTSEREDGQITPPPLLPSHPITSGAPQSIFQVPGMAFLPHLLFESVGLKRLHEAADREGREEAVRQLRRERFDGRHELERFAPYFNPHYNIRKGQVIQDSGR